VTTPPTIRHATDEDLPRIVAIYNAAIPGRLATADTAPVSVESRQEWFEAHWPEKHPVWVLERNGEIGAWISVSAFHDRPAYHRTAEVSLYVAPEAQGEGLGTVLLDKLIMECPRLGLTNLVALIFGHNERSLRLFGRAGFEKWGHLPEVAELDTIQRDLVILGRKVGRVKNDEG